MRAHYQSATKSREAGCNQNTPFAAKILVPRMMEAVSSIRRRVAFLILHLPIRVWRASVNENTANHRVCVVFGTASSSLPSNQP